jgi:hypothetical protein
MWMIRLSRGAADRWHRPPVGSSGGLLASLSALAACGGGAAGPQTGLVPEAELVWPPPPEPARIRYVGVPRNEADLGKRTSFFGRVSRTLVGAESDPHKAMN